MKSDNAPKPANDLLRYGLCLGCGMAYPQHVSNSCTGSHPRIIVIRTIVDPGDAKTLSPSVKGEPK